MHYNVDYLRWLDWIIHTELLVVKWYACSESLKYTIFSR